LLAIGSGEGGDVSECTQRRERERKRKRRSTRHGRPKRSRVRAEVKSGFALDKMLLAGGRIACYLVLPRMAAFFISRTTSKSPVVRKPLSADGHEIIDAATGSKA